MRVNYLELKRACALLMSTTSITGFSVVGARYADLTMWLTDMVERIHTVGGEIPQSVIKLYNTIHATEPIDMPVIEPISRVDTSPAFCTKKDKKKVLASKKRPPAITTPQKDLVALYLLPKLDKYEHIEQEWQKYMQKAANRHIVPPNPYSKMGVAVSYMLHNKGASLPELKEYLNRKYGKDSRVNTRTGGNVMLTSFVHRIMLMLNFMLYADGVDFGHPLNKQTPISACRMREVLPALEMYNTEYGKDSKEIDNFLQWLQRRVQI